MSENFSVNEAEYQGRIRNLLEQLAEEKKKHETFCKAADERATMAEHLLTEKSRKYSDLLQSHYSLCGKIESLEADAKLRDKALEEMAEKIAYPRICGRSTGSDTGDFPCELDAGHDGACARRPKDSACPKCKEIGEGGILKLRETLEHERKMATAYYGEGQKGWMKFRDAEKALQEIVALGMLNPLKSDVFAFQEHSLKVYTLANEALHK